MLNRIELVLPKLLGQHKLFISLFLSCTNENGSSSSLFLHCARDGKGEWTTFLPLPLWCQQEWVIFLSLSPYARENGPASFLFLSGTSKNRSSSSLLRLGEWVIFLSLSLSTAQGRMGQLPSSLAPARMGQSSSLSLPCPGQSIPFF